jgi:flagellar capping protein FliD
MTVNDLVGNIGSSLLSSVYGQAGRASSVADSNDAVSRALDAASQGIDQQRSSTQVSLSAFGQLRSSVDQLQQSSQALTSNESTNTPEEARAAAQTFIDAYNKARITANNVTNRDTGALADNGRALVAASQLSRALDSGSQEQLRQIGINRNQDGTLSLDQQRFQQALQNSPQQVSSSLATVGQQVQDATSQQLASNSQLSRGAATLSDRAQALATQQARIEQAVQQQKAAQEERSQQDQTSAQQQAQQLASQQTTDAGNRLNAIAASGIAAYQRIFSL